MRSDGFATTIFEKEFDPTQALTRESIQEVNQDRVAEIAGLEVNVVERVIQAYAEAVYEIYPHRDPEKLLEYYYGRGMTQSEVAAEVGCCQKQVGKWMRRHDIGPGRGRGPSWRGDLVGEADD